VLNLEKYNPQKVIQFVLDVLLVFTIDLTFHCQNHLNSLRSFAATADIGEIGGNPFFDEAP